MPRATPPPNARLPAPAEDARAPVRPAPAPFLVAIAGGSASGKTWLARRLQRRLRPHAGILSLDAFYRDQSHLPPRARATLNFDAPRALDWPLLVDRLQDLRAGRPTRLPRYDFVSHTRLPSTRPCPARPILLVEGLWPWWRPALEPLFDLRVYLDIPEETRLPRRRQRDLQERGRRPCDVDHQWRRQSQPMFSRFVRPQRARAHLVLGPALGNEQLRQLETHIRSLAGLRP